MTHYRYKYLTSRFVNRGNRKIYNENYDNACKDLTHTLQRVPNASAICGPNPEQSRMLHTIAKLYSLNVVAYRPVAR
jgi:hypothetical protein